MAQYPRGEKGLEDWGKIVETMKKEGMGKKYDCIVGMSGGTDSSYLLHIAKEYKLRVLAVTFNNGWNSTVAEKNIKLITSALNYDIETHIINEKEMIGIFKAYMLASLPWIDSPSDIAIKSTLYKVAARERIKYILYGSDFRSEGKQPLSWTYADTKQLKYLVKKFSPETKLKTFPLQPLHSLFYYGFIKKIKVIRPLYFLPYKKKDAKVLLKEKYGWIDYGGHHHENIFTKFAIQYWLPVKFGIDKRLITLSAQVMSDEITREEALLLINEPTYNSQTIEEDINYVLSKIKLSRNEFNNILNSENKYFYDYPSYYPLFKRFSRVGKIVSSKMFGYKPGIFEAMDQNI